MSSFAYQLEGETTANEASEDEVIEVETIEIEGIEVEVPDEEKRENALTVIRFDAESEEVTTTTEYMAGDVEYTEGSEEAITPRKVIGKEDRLKVMTPNSYPFSSVCFIEWEWQKGTDKNGNKLRGNGSGVLVSGTTVLTAAHNIYNEKWGWATKVTVKPGGVDSRFPAIQVKYQDLFYDDWGFNSNDDPANIYKLV